MPPAAQVAVRDSPPRLLFIGWGNWPPNRQAARLIRECWPSIRRGIDGAELWIVGGDGTSGGSAPDDSVKELGFVPDVDAVMEQCRALAAPIVTGGGVRVKILHAVSRGLPVVTTSTGLGSLDQNLRHHATRRAVRLRDALPGDVAVLRRGSRGGGPQLRGQRCTLGQRPAGLDVDVVVDDVTFAAVAVIATVLMLGLLTAAAWMVFARPLLLIRTTVFVLACAPTLQIPVVHVAVIMPLVLMCVASRFTVRFERQPLRPVEIGVLILIFVSLFSFLANRLDTTSFRDFFIWAAMSALIFPLAALRVDQLIRVGRSLAFGAGVGAGFGIVLRFADPHGQVLSRLTFLGYSATGYNGHYIPTANGDILRLTGAYLDPNLGALLMATGLVFALALLRGSVRFLVCATTLTAVALTFSRAVLGAVVVGAVVLVVAGRVPRGTRKRIAAALLATAVAVLTLPGFRERLTNSFTSNDVGSQARGAALKNFPGEMAGHWLLGRGFGVPALIDGKVAYANVKVLPANAPLLALYRGGIVVGLVFAALLLLAGARALRLLRSGSLAGAAIGAGFIGILLVALQLDIPVVIQAPAIAMLSVYLAFLDHPDLAGALARASVHSPPPAARLARPPVMVLSGVD